MQEYFSTPPYLRKDLMFKGGMDKVELFQQVIEEHRFNLGDQ